MKALLPVFSSVRYVILLYLIHSVPVSDARMVTDSNLLFYKNAPAVDDVGSSDDSLALSRKKA